MKKIYAFCAIVFCACCFLFAGISSTTVQAAIQTDIELYALDEWCQKYIQIPDSAMKSYQIEVPGGQQARYRVVDGESVTVSSSGLIEPAKETWYVNGNMSTTFPQGGPNEKVEIENVYGKSVVQVTTASQTYDITVNVKDYAEQYAETVMDEYLHNKITESMSDFEKLEAIAAFPAQYDYSASASSYKGMIVTGGGDCWASTSAIIHLCEKVQLQAHVRYAVNDGNAGSGHRNAAVKIGDSVYVVEAGYNETKPRNYNIWEEKTGFDYSIEDGKVEIKQYDGFSSDIVIPAEIKGYPVTSIGDSAFYYGERYSDVPVHSVQLPDTIVHIGKNAFARTSIKSIRLPASVQTIHTFAFSESDLTEIQVADGNASYSSTDGVLFDADRKILIAFPAGKQGVYYIPDGVTAISTYAFGYTKKLQKVVVPESVTSIGEGAFGGCQLKEVYFKGDVPVCDKYLFFEMTLKVFYPEGKSWTAESIQEHEAKKISWSTWDTSSVVTEEEKTVPIESIELNAKRIALSVGTEFQLKASLSPENAENALNWTSSDSSVATVSSDGLVRAIGEGEALITAGGKDGSDKKASCTVIVSTSNPVQQDPIQTHPVQGDVTGDIQTRPIQNPVSDNVQNDPVQKNEAVLIQNITLDKSAVSLNQSERIQLTATVFPANADQNLDWTSSNPSATTVSNTGLVTAVGAGQTVITVKGRDGSGKSAVCTVNVSNASDKQENHADQNTESDSSTDSAGNDQEKTPAATSLPMVGTKLKDKTLKAVFQVTKQGAAGREVTFLKPLNSKVQKITIPASVSIDGVTYKVTAISASACKNHKNLKTAVIGKNVLVVGKDAFYGCTRLKSISMGENIRTIGNRAFYKCTAINKIVIPNKVTKIGTQAFFGDKKLSNMNIQTLHLINRNVGSKAFDGIGSQAVYTVPRVKAQAYKKLLIKKGADL